MNEAKIVSRLKHFFTNTPTFSVLDLPKDAIGRVFDGIIYTATKHEDGSGYRMIQVYFLDLQNTKLYRTPRAFGNIIADVPVRVDCFGSDLFHMYYHDTKFRIMRNDLLSELSIRQDDLKKSYAIT